MKGSKAKYTIMIPQASGLSEHALRSAVEAPVRIDHCYLDRDKWAHSPGAEPELHDHLVLHGDESPEMDSHVKQLARQVAQRALLPTVFALKEGQKGPISWLIDAGRQGPAPGGASAGQGMGISPPG